MSAPVMFNIHDAKTHLSQLIARAEAGEEVIIGRSGTPAVRLVAINQPQPQRTPGIWRGQVWISDDFDEPMPELSGLMEDGPVFPEEESPK